MSDTFEQKSTLQYESYNDIAKPVLKDGLLIHDPTPRVEQKAITYDDEPSKVNDPMKEGYTDAELWTLYNTIAPNKGEYSTDESKNVTQRKYDMDTKITYPPNHRNYKPSDKDIIMNDTSQQMDQQYNTMLMTVAATASLGIIVFMLTSNTPSSGASL